jgi:hypothetical protein
VRCGPINQKNSGGHAHNDQLAIELQIKGVDWVRDPGSFIYTANPKQRDLYRSVVAHSSPYINNSEPSNLTSGMFCLKDSFASKCLRFDTSGFHGIHSGYNQLVFRQIQIEKKCIKITDGFDGNFPDESDQSILTAKSPVELQTIFGMTLPFSRGYGIIDD